MNYTVKLRDHERAAQKLGNLENTISAIRVFRNNMSNEMLMQGFHIDKPTLDNILEMIDNYPDWTERTSRRTLSGSNILQRVLLTIAEIYCII